MTPIHLSKAHENPFATPKCPRNSSSHSPKTRTDRRFLLRVNRRLETHSSGAHRRIRSDGKIDGKECQGSLTNARDLVPPSNLRSLIQLYLVGYPDLTRERLALQVECPVCNQIHGLPCLCERSKFISEKRVMVLLFRPHWQKITLAMGPRPKRHQLRLSKLPTLPQRG